MTIAEKNAGKGIYWPENIVNALNIATNIFSVFILFVVVYVFHKISLITLLNSHRSIYWWNMDLERGFGFCWLQY